MSHDDVLRDLHAKYHDQGGNLLGDNECEWLHCPFWEVASFVVGVHGANGYVVVPRHLLDELLAASQPGEMALWSDHRDKAHQRLKDARAAVVEAVGPTREDGK